MATSSKYGGDEVDCHRERGAWPSTHVPGKALCPQGRSPPRLHHRCTSSERGNGHDRSTNHEEGGPRWRRFKTGGRLIRHAWYFTLQLAESYLTGPLVRQILARIERLTWHPT